MYRIRKAGAAEAGKNEANRRRGGGSMLTVEDQNRKTSDMLSKYVVPTTL